MKKVIDGFLYCLICQHLTAHVVWIHEGLVCRECKECGKKILMGLS